MSSESHVVCYLGDSQNTFDILFFFKWGNTKIDLPACDEIDTDGVNIGRVGAGQIGAVCRFQLHCEFCKCPDNGRFVASKSKIARSFKCSQLQITSLGFLSSYAIHCLSRINIYTVYIPISINFNYLKWQILVVQHSLSDVNSLDRVSFLQRSRFSLLCFNSYRTIQKQKTNQYISYLKVVR